MVTDQLLTELERQQKYLDELPSDFTFPLFNVRHAVESQRRSGYQDTAAASREIVDNAVEAGATRIDVVFDTEPGRKSVRAIAFLDNGSGMLSEMIRYALTWGGGTHFDDHDFIGRFGFGLPNSSINQTRHVDVFSRASSDQPFMCGSLDITEPSKFGVQSIAVPTEAKLPPFVETYLKKAKIDFQHGTVVVWQKPDRLTYKKASTLGEHLVEDFAVTYRYHLVNPETNPEGLTLVVNGTEVGPVDPLFLTPGARLYLAEGEGGAVRVQETAISVRYWEDPETGERHLARNETSEEIDVAIADGATVGAIKVIIARLPTDFVRRNAPVTPDAKKRFEIRKSRRGMSFVRSNREIQTVDAFPRSSKDKSSGLGDWPLLQSYAYNWGIEVRFDPSLDDVFGITNDKQGVRPIEDFWRLLADEEIDTAANREQRWQADQRSEAAKIERSGQQATDSEAAAQAADVGTSTRPEVPPREREAARDNLDKAAEEKASQGQGDADEARKALEDQAKHQKYRIEYGDVIGGPIYDCEWVGAQMVMTINRQHLLYQVLFGDLVRLKAGRGLRAAELMLLTLARAELKVIEEDKALFYSAQRRTVWSPFLCDALANLGVKMPDDDEDHETVDAAGAANAVADDESAA
jgi:hypothetical protein